MSFEVVIYSRPGCCLCDRAEDILHALQGEFAGGEYSFLLRKVNIDEDETLREKYCCQIPVVTINGGNRVALRITEERLRRAFNLAAKRRT
jgi:glutaredoxin